MDTVTGKICYHWNDDKSESKVNQCCASASASCFGKSDPDPHHKPDPNLRQIQSSKTVEAQSGAMAAHHRAIEGSPAPCRLIREDWKITMEPWKVCGSVVAASHT